MRNLILVLSALTLAACGGKHFTDPDLVTYVSKFESVTGKKVEYDVTFATLNKPVVGLCTSGGGFAKVEIDPTYWKDLNDTQREQLVFHELGHCSLGRGHNAATSGGYPSSVMNPYAFNWYEAAYYASHTAQYWQELMHPSTIDTAIVKLGSDSDNDDCADWKRVK